MASTLSKSNVLVGGKVVLYMDDLPIGFAQAARCRDDYALEPIQVLGQLQAIEYVPTHARHEISCTLMVLKNDSLAKRNLEPTGAGNFGFLASGTIGLTGGAKDFSGLAGSDANTANTSTGLAANSGLLRELHGKTFDIKIVDASAGTTGTTLVEYTSCYFASGDLDVQSNRVLMHNVTFYALDRKGTLSNTVSSANVA